MPILLQNRQHAVAINSARLSRTAEAVLSAARAGDAELSLVLVSDQRMRSLNRRYRKKDRPTDVLAFPMREEKRGQAPFLTTSEIAPPSKKRGLSPFPVLLGDVVISMQTAKRQAAAYGHGLYDEVTRLLVHGVLHLLGYDHERGAREAASMARKEQAILKAVRNLPA